MHAEATRQLRHTLEQAQLCPLCLNVEKIARPLERHLALRGDGLHESWFCRACHATYMHPCPTGEARRAFGESPLG